MGLVQTSTSLQLGVRISLYCSFSTLVVAATDMGMTILLMSKELSPLLLRIGVGMLVALCPVMERGVEASEEVDICLRRGLWMGVCTPNRDGHGLPTSGHSFGIFSILSRECSRGLLRLWPLS